VELKSEQTVFPFSVHADLTLNETDIRRAFVQADPDEQLFYDEFGPEAKNAPASVRLRRLARICELVEQSDAQDTAALNLTAVNEPRA